MSQTDDQLAALARTFDQLGEVSVELERHIGHLNDFITAVAQKLRKAKVGVGAGVTFKADRGLILQWERLDTSSVSARECNFFVHEWDDNQSSSEQQPLLSTPLLVRAAAAKVLPELVEMLLKKTREISAAVVDAIPEIMLRDDVDGTASGLLVSEEPQGTTLEEEGPGARR
jgi:hypothetical protein